MNIKKRLLLALILVFLGGFFFAFNHAKAQTDTTVFLLPDPATVYLNGSNNQVVDVWVADVVNMNGFDITITYDPTMVNRVSWVEGDFLEIAEGYCFIPPGFPDQPGFFRRVCVQLGKDLKSGSGVLFSMTFNGSTYGTSDINIVNPTLALEVMSYSIYPPESSGAFNATYNPGIVKPVVLNGAVSMQGRTNQSGANIRLTGQVIGRGYSGASTDASGNNYIFNNIAMDLYTVWTNTQGYLNIPANMNKQIALIGAETTLNPLHLVGGNAVWSNNEIDIHDLSLVAGNFGKTNYDSRADINGNGKVDIFDLALVAGNFGKTSEEEYASWQP